MISKEWICRTELRAELVDRRFSRRALGKPDRKSPGPGQPLTLMAGTSRAPDHRRVRQQHERITLTRNGEPEAVLVSVDDLEGLEMTLEILGDTEAVARISESLAALGRGEPGADLATVRKDLARRRATGT